MKLFINAKDGIAYQASAILRDEHGQLVAEGVATLAPRGGLASAQPGLYKLSAVHALPRSGQVRHEWGTHGFIFECVDRPEGEPLLIHGGDMYAGSQPRAVHGSGVRVDKTVFGALLDGLNRLPQPAKVRLSVQIGSAPRPWQLWRRPSATSRVPDQGLDVWDVLYPEQAPFRHPNSATAWLHYFRHAHESSPGIVSGKGGDYAGGGASGTWGDETIAAGPSRDERHDRDGRSHAPSIAGAATAPLFTISPQEGIDRFGRVEHANAPVETFNQASPFGTALVAGLTLAASDELMRAVHAAILSSAQPAEDQSDGALHERPDADGAAAASSVELSTSY